MWSLLFPPTCMACRVLLRHRHRGPELCSRCVVTTPPLPEHLRMQGSVVACFAYCGAMADALLRLKYGGDRALAGPLGRALAADPWLRGSPEGPWTDVLAIPPHHRRVRSGAGDHAQRMLDHALAQPGLSLRPRAWLASHPERVPQVGRSAPERLRLDPGGFVLSPRATVRGRAILVVDDVTTTGATMGAALRLLMGAGARRVGGLALMRTLPES